MHNTQNTAHHPPHTIEHTRVITLNCAPSASRTNILWCSCICAYISRRPEDASRTIGSSRHVYVQLSFQDLYEGLGQGNGAASTGWLVVSSVLLTFMRTFCACTKGVSTMSRRPFEYVACGVVDATDIPMMVTSAEETPEHVFPKPWLRTGAKPCNTRAVFSLTRNLTGGQYTLSRKEMNGIRVNAQLEQRSLCQHLLES